MLLNLHYITLMFDQRHANALHTFESDSQFDIISGKVEDFRNKQRRIAKTKDEQFVWINENKRLQQAENAVTRQISNCLSKLISECEKENNVKAYNDTKSIADDFGAYETLSNRQSLLSVAVDVKETMTSLNNDGLRSQLILDTKEHLLAVEEELREQQSLLISDLHECKRKAMSLIDADINKCGSDEPLLPYSVIKALAAARAAEKTNLGEGSHGEFQVDLLEHELKQEFADERKKLSLALASSAVKHNALNWDEQSINTLMSIYSTTKKHSLLSRKEEDQILKRLSLALPHKTNKEIKAYMLQLDARRSTKAKEKYAHQKYEKKCFDIERQGIIAVKKLISDIEKRNESTEAERLIRVKSNELRLRLQAQRIERIEANEHRGATNVVAEKGSPSNAHREMQSKQRSLRVKQALWNDESKNTHERVSMADEINKAALRISQHRANKARTIHRALQLQDKIQSKKNADTAAAKTEERRLEQLCALAASVPYYKNIIDATPDIYKTTEARKADIFTKRDTSLADFQCGLHQLKSFTNDKVFSDSKFRLANALHEAGLARSSYARDVVRNAIPRKEERTTGIRPY